ncbi:MULTISPECIES: hypothetical protein [Nostoc]|uniref:Uncharacterized protein n=2 Tax=Nostoc TaxID=1177 RepID=A0ABR8IJ14_9NOSO|nr:MULTISPECIES: hypothetical protein [Nostoc]MBD2565425.1 hypothetical protein [Nostoc linckia FACHB-391]MBD2651149.1 hypothetical protein [Nostoc foliaceum FACHB-393]
MMNYLDTIIAKSVNAFGDRFCEEILPPLSIKELFVSFKELVSRHSIF